MALWISSLNSLKIFFSTIKGSAPSNSTLERLPLAPDKIHLQNECADQSRRWICIREEEREIILPGNENIDKK
jgi:hypothetical protein